MKQILQEQIQNTEYHFDMVIDLDKICPCNSGMDFKDCCACSCGSGLNSRLCCDTT